RDKNENRGCPSEVPSPLDPNMPRLFGAACFLDGGVARKHQIDTRPKESTLTQARGVFGRTVHMYPFNGDDSKSATECPSRPPTESPSRSDSNTIGAQLRNTFVLRTSALNLTGSSKLLSARLWSA